MWIYAVLILAGLALGMLVNSLADNLPPDAQEMRHRPRTPRCHACQEPHRPRYWLGLAALVLRRGRCEHCAARRPARAVAVEVLAAAGTALVWAWAAHRAAAEAGPAWVDAVRFLAGLFLFHCFLLITVVDVEHRLILWNVVWPSALVIGAAGLVLPEKGLVKTLLGGLVGYGVTLGIFLLAELYSRFMHWLRGRPLEEVAFGGGDVNLAGLAGLAVGWPGIVLTLLIAILSGGLVSLLYIIVQLVRGRYAPHSAMPYGPFLVLGGLLIYFFGRDLAALWPIAAPPG
jgi:leader peptidase (prepilin peptidase)/N-methyltransferase